MEIDSKAPSRNTRNAVIPEVKSGIALSGFRGIVTDASSTKQTFLTSRIARVMLAGAGFLADAYDLFIINLVLRLLRDEYPHYVASNQLHACEGMVASAALIGSIIGQLVAGSLADIIGRKKIFVTTAILISLGSFGSATSIDASYMSVYANLSIWRFFLGLGVGGEYPLAATVTSESSSATRRGSLMASVFSMQGVGALLSAFVVIVCLAMGMSKGFTWRFALAFGAVPVAIAFPWRIQMHETETFERVKSERLKSKLEEARRNALQPNSLEDSTQPLVQNSSNKEYGTTTDLESFEISDRNSDGDYYIGGYNSRDNSGGYSASELSNHRSNGYGRNSRSKPAKPLTRAGVPSALKQVSSFGSVNEYQDLINRDRGSRTPSMLEPSLGHLSEISKAFKYYKFHMVGTALCWFLLDVDFYANGLFNHDITASVLNSPGQTTTALQDAINTAILGCIAVPGYWLSVIFIDKIGRKVIQMVGFCMMGALFVVCGFFYDWLMDSTDPTTSYRKYIFLLLYALTFLFSNFGPNTTSFVIPGEIFPTEVRATCHGISAASGKLGAASGAYIFPMLLGPGGAANPTHEGIQNCMFICGAIAILGAIVTFIFTPTYSSIMLAVEGRYLPLDFECLRPSVRELALIDESWAETATEMSYVGNKNGSSFVADNHGYPPLAKSGRAAKLNTYPDHQPFEMQQIVCSTDDYSMDVLTPVCGTPKARDGPARNKGSLQSHVLLNSHQETSDSQLNLTNEDSGSPFIGQHSSQQEHVQALQNSVDKYAASIGINTKNIRQ